MEQDAGNLPGARVLFERGLGANPRNVPCLQVVIIFKWIFWYSLCVFLLGLLLGCLKGRLVFPNTLAHVAYITRISAASLIF